MRKLLACTALLAVTLPAALPAHAQQEPKPEVFAKFGQWANSKMTGKPQTKSMAVRSLRASGDTTGGAFIARSMSDAPVGNKESLLVTSDKPTTVITLEEGSPDYQGAHIAIVGADKEGNITDVRSAKSGFRTGERFKVRAVSTFGGHLVIENINAKGERRQIYPPEGTSVVVIQPGEDTLVPLGPQQFFEFAKTTGEEQLVISLRDPRAIGDAASRQKVFRKDEELGTHFIQEVAKGEFPVISEAIKLEHQ